MGEKRSRHAQLIEQLYEGVLTEDGWTDALKSFAEISGSIQVSLIVLDKQTDRLAVGEHFNMPEEVVSEYNNHYYLQDPGVAFVDRIALGKWFHDRRELGEHVMQKIDFYQDFMRRHKLATVIANHLLNDDTQAAFLSMQRLIGQPHYDDGDFRNMEELIPHVQRAVRIRMRLQELAGRSDLSAVVLDQLGAPILVVDEDRRVLMANTSAEAVMRNQDLIVVRGGRFAMNGAQPDKLEQLVRAACGLDGPAVAGGIRLLDRKSLETLQIVVLPLPTRVQLSQYWSKPVALVIIQNRDAPASSQEQLIRQIYGLTMAEGRITHAMVEGKSPGEIAEEIGISVNTVRWHLKTIYQKAGITRQADLLRMLASLTILK